MAVEPDAWTKLFEPPPGPAGSVLALPVRILHKRKRPFLLFPPVPRAAAVSLELYSAQKTLARVLRGLLRRFFAMGLYPFTKNVKLAIPGHSELGSFLIGLQKRTPPLFCSLAGNPNAAGQRFVFLLLDNEHQPQTVVKAGVGGRARELIEHETAFLLQHAARLRNIPRVLDTL